MNSSIRPARPSMSQALDAAIGAGGAIIPTRIEDVSEQKALFSPSQLVVDALAMAIETYGVKARGVSGVPCISHLMAVASITTESGGGEDEMLAALLHEMVEVGGGPAVLDTIRERFGANVAAIVAGCTDDPTGENTLSWLERKRRHLGTFSSATLPTLRVICADKLHNVHCMVRDIRDHGPGVIQKLKGDRDGTLWYYRSLARIFSALLVDEPQLDIGFRAMIRELRETVVKLEASSSPQTSSDR